MAFNVLLNTDVGNSGLAVIVVSLGRQFAHSQNSTKLVDMLHFNRDGATDNTRPVSVAWVPNSRGDLLAAAHLSGMIYIYSKVRAILPCRTPHSTQTLGGVHIPQCNFLTACTLVLFTWSCLAIPQARHAC